MPQAPAIAVEIWLWDNADFEAQGAELCAWLNAEERARRDRKADPRHGLHWAISRAKVRQKLSAVLQVAPEDIAFETNQYGHLSVANAAAQSVWFNISHAGSLTALAISASAPVGVDIEPIQPLNAEEMDWPLSALERTDLAKVPVNDRLAAFFRYWTLKEAFIKGMGMGVSFPLHDFSISSYDAPPALADVAGTAVNPGDWTFEALEILPNMRFALAAKTSGENLECKYNINSEA